MDNKEQTKLVLCDLSKAFDTVPHKELLYKLDKYGVRGEPNELIRSYLENRVQTVFWKGEFSFKSNIINDVPQGSILGPLLFIIYLNDISDYVGTYATGQYADDTSFLVKGTNILEVELESRRVIDKAKTWFDDNGLIMNDSKTQTLTFSTGKEEVSKVGFLGLILQSNLGWSSHIDHLAKRLSRASYAIRRLKIAATHQTARIAYFANFHSLLSYGILLWGTSSQSQQIFILQKKVLRMLADLNSRDSCRAAFKSQGILTLPSVYILACLKYVHNHKEKFVKNNSTHFYNTRNQEALQTPYHRLSLTQNALNYWGPKLYNRIPCEMGKLSAPAFEKELRNILLTNPFYSVDEFMNFQISACPQD